MEKLYGVSEETCRCWLTLFHKDLERYFKRVAGHSVGDSGDTVVVDESLWGVWAMTPAKAKLAQAKAPAKPKAKGRPAAPTHTNTRHSAARVNRPGPNAKAKRMLAFRVIKDRVKQRNPANTVWTKKATAARDEFVRNNPKGRKTSHNKQVAGTAQDVRHRGRWLFVAVRVGTGARGRSPGTLCTVDNKLKRISGL
jgi:hypothetical protein